MVDTPDNDQDAVAHDDRRVVHFADQRPRTREGRLIHPRRPIRPGEGRPTVYQPEHCQLIEQLAADKGYGPAQLARSLGIDKATFHRWAAGYPEFGDSVSRAKTFEQAYWEDVGHGALKRKHFQAQVWRTSMAARFKDDYTEGRMDVVVSLGDLVERSLAAKPVTAQVVTQSVTPAEPKPTEV